MHTLEHFQQQYPFPPLEEWPEDAPLAWGGSLLPGRLVSAYSQGIFPWYSAHEPILWWSPDPRCVLFLDDFTVSHSLSRVLKKNGWEVRVDTQFKHIIESCSQVPRPKQKGTWLTDEMIAAYVALHEMGLAHSFETYFEGELVGGLYGTSLGKIFFGESMFAHKTNASKIALVYLVKLLKHHQFDLIDCQVYNPHLASLGAKNIPRSDFLRVLNTSVAKPSWIGSWTKELENLLRNST